jgi:hypothetical protein
LIWSRWRGPTSPTSPRCSIPVLCLYPSSESQDLGDQSGPGSPVFLRLPLRPCPCPSAVVLLAGVRVAGVRVGCGPPRRAPIPARSFLEERGWGEEGQGGGEGFPPPPPLVLPPPTLALPFQRRAGLPLLATTLASSGSPPRRPTPPPPSAMPPPPPPPMAAAAATSSSLVVSTTQVARGVWGWGEVGGGGAPGLSCLANVPASSPFSFPVHCATTPTPTTTPNKP